MRCALPLASSFSYTGSSASTSCPISKSSVTFTSYITGGGTCHAAPFFDELVQHFYFLDKNYFEMFKNKITMISELGFESFCKEIQPDPT